MGIIDIHILHPDPKVEEQNAFKTQAYIEARRVLEHHAGQHPYGSMRRDCPLCQAGK